MSLIALVGAVVALASSVQNDADYSAARNRPWRVGDERELTAGSYTTLFDEFEGWRIWRDEYRSGVSCAAVKPAQGVAHPKPMSTRAFFDAAPAVHLLNGYASGGKPHLEWRLIGEWYDPGTQEFRAVGDRFYTSKPSLLAPADQWLDLLARDGQSIEVHVVSWQYPSIYQGRSEQTGTIDLSGMNRAITRLAECEAS